jgi:hypothetical protein
MEVKQRVGELMREVIIRPEQIEEARRKAKEMGALNNSILEGKGNVYGFMGEIVFAEAMGLAFSNTFDYDFILDGIKIDVKTKHCTSPPRPEYECSVADVNKDQDCHFYVFVRVMKDLSKAWILGKKRKADYYNEATFYKKGQEDPNSKNGFEFTADCYNLKISDLMPIIYPERNEPLLELYAKYLLLPTCKFTDPSSENSIIYKKGYVVITGLGFDDPNPHRHYTLLEFEEKINEDAKFKEFCENLKLPK